MGTDCCVRGGGGNIAEACDVAVTGGGGGGGTSWVFWTSWVFCSPRVWVPRNLGAAALAAATVSVSTMLSDLKLFTGPGLDRPSNGSLTSNLLHRRLSGAQSPLTREFRIGANFARSARSFASFGSSTAPADTKDDAMVSPGLSARDPWPMSCVSSVLPDVNMLPRLAWILLRSPAAIPLTLITSGCFSGTLVPGGGAADSGLAAPPPFIVAGNGVSPSILARSSASSGLGRASPSAMFAQTLTAPVPAPNSRLHSPSLYL